MLQINRNPNFSVSRQEHTYRDGLCCLGAAVQFPIWLLHREMLSTAAKSLHGSLGSWESPRWLNSLTTRVFLQIGLKRRVTQNGKWNGYNQTPATPLWRKYPRLGQVLQQHHMNQLSETCQISMYIHHIRRETQSKK